MNTLEEDIDDCKKRVEYDDRGAPLFARRSTAKPEYGLYDMHVYRTYHAP